MSTTETSTRIRVQYVDPREVVIKANVRTQVNLTREFVASIKRHGVIVPVIGYPGEDGRVTVEEGQRRILGAIEAERFEVPAYIVPESDTEAIRIIRQLIANDQRTALTDGERAAAWKQLELDGLSVTAIARELGEKPKRVKAGLAVVDSEVATNAVTEHQLTLDQALVLIKFEDDPELVRTLEESARNNPDGFAHYAQRLRDQRDTDRQVASLIEGFAQRGIRVIDWPGWDDKTTARVEDLEYADGAPLTIEGYEGKPGHAIAVHESWRGVEFGHFVTDFKAHGLRKPSATGAPVGKWTEEEKTERRTLIANNKAWGSAEVVRREWLASFLSRRTLPKDALPFAATVLVAHTSQLRSALDDHHAVALELLGFEYKWGTRSPLAPLVEHNPAKTGTVLVAVAVAAMEGATSKNTWRNPTSDDVAYFTALQGWGYTLSEVEDLVLGISPQPNPADEDDAPVDEASTPDETDVAEPADPESDAADSDPDHSGPTDVVDQDTDGE
ncbi:ParB/RepB/Spo0J family partition protein [Lacisediminihabitans sp. H27-G8]|uniref:ParB/RepB/Spo0J family partition protein n=1 Tax=Lacisediminihabitans sp. H27-G8 TaxID=3111909 RepID=UPI0038FD3289